jgi:hypothetical protein
MRPSIVVAFSIYLAYVAGVLLLAARVNLWQSNELKDSVIITLFVGFPMLFKVTNLKDEFDFLRDVARDSLRISALLIFYLNIAPAALWVEVVVQAVLGLLLLFGAVSSMSEETKQLRRPVAVLVTLISVGLLVDSTVRIITSWSSLDLGEIGSSFLLSLWLPLVIAAYVYALAPYAGYDRVLRMATVPRDGRRLSVSVAAGLVIGSRFRTANTGEVIGFRIQELAEATRFRSALHVMTEVRTTRITKHRQEAANRKRLKQFTGVKGLDADGLTIDRREFGATKKALTAVFFMEMGQRRNAKKDRFRGDMVQHLTRLNTRGLPEPHGIAQRTRKDHRAWMAWRTTPSGHVFGVGGSRNIAAHWQFDGADAPRTFPGEGPGWTNAAIEQSSREWLAIDPTPEA